MVRRVRSTEYERASGRNYESLGAHGRALPWEPFHLQGPRRVGVEAMSSCMSDPCLLPGSSSRKPIWPRVVAHEGMLRHLDVCDLSSAYQIRAHLIKSGCLSRSSPAAGSSGLLTVDAGRGASPAGIRGSTNRTSTPCGGLAEKPAAPVQGPRKITRLTICRFPWLLRRLPMPAGASPCYVRIGVVESKARLIRSFPLPVRFPLFQVSELPSLALSNPACHQLRST